MSVQKSSSPQRPFTDPIYDAPAPLQTPSVQAKRRNVDWSRVTVEAQSPARNVQAKLSVGAPGDKYEQEADAMANKVMTMPAPGSEQPIQREAAPEEKQEEVQAKPLAASITPLVQRETAPEENKEEEVQAKSLPDSIQRETAPEENKEEEVQAKSLPDSIQRETASEENFEEEVQAKSLPGNIQREMASEENFEEEVQAKPAPERNSQASGNVESQLSASKGGGSALPDEVRSFMEPRFGADLSYVRVHTDGAAVQMNKELGAQAFAHGSDIYYGAGKSPGNNELTAHELTHVVQQTGASSIKRSADSSVQRKCAACEAEEAEVANTTPSMNLSKSAEQLLQRQASPAAGSPMHPPGDCTPGEHRQLQDEVQEWCKNKPRGCEESQTLEELEERIENNSKCIAARNRINNKCFRGGDAGHKEALQIAINSLVRCQRVRDRVKARQPQPQNSPDFMKKMSEITGLTGTALLIYLIISEGSRLFPPRNLVPVP